MLKKWPIPAVIVIGAVFILTAGAAKTITGGQEFQTIADKASALKNLYALVLYRSGGVKFEAYFHGQKPGGLCNIKSAAKSILSSLVGIALKEGYLHSVDQPVCELIPEYFGKDTGPAKKAITIRHLLTMTSGLDSASNKDYGKWKKSADWTAAALSAKLVSTPGTKYVYSTADAHILAAALTKAIGRDLLDYANEKLFAQLGITVIEWDKSPEGFRFGGNDLYMAPADLAKFGILYLHGGIWDGVQVVPGEWVALSTGYQVRPELWSPFPVTGYGYYWWRIDIAGMAAYAAWGHAGQYCIVIPELDTVLVAASDWNAGYSKQYYKKLAGVLIGILNIAQK
ncbi:MAG: serine hydrolase [Brevinematales bacterium]|nr:serine hydrolase [Brevinematales bacterium]